VGKEIEVGDGQEELGGGQTEPMRTQIREESSEGVQREGETQTLRGFCHWQGGFEWRYKIGAGRVESREKGKLGQMEFQITCLCDGRNCQDLEVCEDQKYYFSGHCE
jgi:hypothetical protein